MTDQDGIPPVPEGLGARGAEFWREIHGVARFEPNDTALVMEACRTLDVIDALASAIATDGLFTKGSMGQDVLNPAVAELRQQQAAFGRLIGLVSLPEKEKAQDMWLHRRAKAGAAARWNRPGVSAQERWAAVSGERPSTKDRLRAINGGDDWMSHVTIKES
jgi:hypothetical protein